MFNQPDRSGIRRGQKLKSVRTALENIASVRDFHAEYEGSLPFTRSIIPSLFKISLISCRKMAHHRYICGCTHEHSMIVRRESDVNFGAFLRTKCVAGNHALRNASTRHKISPIRTHCRRVGE